MAANSSPSGSSLSSYKPSSNVEDVPWNKNKSNGRSIHEYEVVEENYDSSTNMFCTDQTDEKAFGKWLDRDSDEGTKSLNKDSRELLDDNYPSKNPPRSHNKYKPIKFSIDSTKSECKNRTTECSSWDDVDECNFDDLYNESNKTPYRREPKTPHRVEHKTSHPSELETPHCLEPKTPRRGQPKTPHRMNLFDDDDDVIVLGDDVGPSRTSERLKSSIIENNIGNTKGALKNERFTTNTDPKIPALMKESEPPGNLMFNVPQQFNLPPPSYPGHSFEMSSNPSNSFIASFHQSNSGVYNHYGTSSLIINPPPPNLPFFNPPDPRIMYSNFAVNTRQQPVFNNWATSVNSVAPNVRSIWQTQVYGNVYSGEDTAKKLQKSSEDAVKNELRRQNLNLMAQRETYFKQYAFLNDELEKLIKQKKDLIENEKAERYLKANQELQSDIQNKMKAVKNVIDMLSKIIKDDNDFTKPAENYVNGTKKIEMNDSKRNSLSMEKKLKSRSRSRSVSKHRSRSRSRGRRSRSPRQRSRSRSYSPKRHRRRTPSRERNHRRRYMPENHRHRSEENKSVEEKSQMSEPKSIVKRESLSPSKGESSKHLESFKSTFEENEKSVEVEVPKAKIVSKQQITKNVNYVHYDPEIHWCQVCDVFPKTAKEYLLHLHDQKHKEELAKRNMIDYPWHRVQTNTPRPVYPDAPTERVPICGLPFFVSAAAWYCKLCNEWMGDLHCASTHLKSEGHEAKYKTFVSANILWEETWTQSRTKAIELYSRAQTNQNNVFTCAVSPFLPTAAADEARHVNEQGSPSQTKRASSFSSSSNGRNNNSYSRNDIDYESSKLMNTKCSQPQNLKKSSNREEPSARTSAEMRTRPPPTSPEMMRQPVVEMYTKPWEKNDKFVDEWMQHPSRDRGKEREIEELKNKLKRKEAEERSRAEERTRTSFGNRRRISPSPQSNSHPYSLLLTEKSSDKSCIRGPSSTGVSKKMLERPITISKGKFPFIGKMPFRARKSEMFTMGARIASDAKSTIVIKADSNASLFASKNSGLSQSIEKQVQQYGKIEKGGGDTTVVDMGINDEDVTSAAGCIDNDRLKNDFGAALKRVSSEAKCKEAIQPLAKLGQQFTEVPPVVAPEVPQNLIQNSVSLIKSTHAEKLILGFRPQNDLAIDSQSSSEQLKFVTQSLMAPGTEFVPEMVEPAAETLCPPGTMIPPGFDMMVADIPVPHEMQATLRVNPVDDERDKKEAGGSSDLESDATTKKKKKNRMSQKNRRYMAKLRQKLEEQEKELQAKIEEKKKNMAAAVANNLDDKKTISEPVVMNDIDNDLMLLGIDESDSAALQL